MNLWAALMLAAGGIFAGGAATFAWSRVPIWRRMPTPDFVGDFGETIRWTDKVQPALLVLAIVGTLAYAMGSDGAARLVAFLAAAGFFLTLVGSIAVMVPLQRQIISAPLSRSVGARYGGVLLDGRGRGAGGRAMSRTVRVAATGVDGEASGPAGRPTNFVAGVIHDETAYRSAVEALVADGHDQAALGLLHGRRGADAIANRHRHWWSDLLSDEPSYVERFEEEIRAGGYVIGVPLRDARGSTQAAARELLKRHGAQFVVSSTRWTHQIEE
jgi:hypothetical protein